MISDIGKCSVQYIRNALSPLENFKNHVFWIRNRDMTKQIYMSGAFQSIWGRDENLVYEVPLICFDFIHPDNKLNAIQQWSNRHNLSYLYPEKNIVFYKIIRADNEARYICCQCFKCEGPDRTQYIVGIAKNMLPEIWYPKYNQPCFQSEKEDEDACIKLFFLLKENFGIHKIEPMKNQQPNFNSLRDYLMEAHTVKFSPRELECLAYLCQGKTAKLVAREMSISFKTVQSYIETIRAKTSCSNKSEVISRFSRYFTEEA